MNILLSFLQSEVQHPIPAYSFWQYHIKNGITEAGHTWTEQPNMDWAEGLTYLRREEQELWKAKTWSTFLKWVKKTLKTQKIDLFLSYLYPQQIQPEYIEEIQRLGIPCVNFFCDNVREFTKVPKEFGAFDLNWVPEYKAISLYRKAKINYIHAPMPMWVKPELRNTCIQEKYPVSFIGSKDMQRIRLLGEAVQKGLELEIRGSGWMEGHKKAVNPTSISLVKKAINQIDFVKKYGLYGYYRKWENRSVSYPEHDSLKRAIREKPDFLGYTDITRSSQVTLGINRYPSFKHPISKPDTYSRLRDIEAPMLGACYLTEWTEGLDKMYDLDREISVYRNEDELIEQTKALVRDHARRKSLREKGQKRALDQLSIVHSLKTITNSL